MITRDEERGRVGSMAHIVKWKDQNHKKYSVRGGGALPKASSSAVLTICAIDQWISPSCPLFCAQWPGDYPLLCVLLFLTYNPGKKLETHIIFFSVDWTSWFLGSRREDRIPVSSGWVVALFISRATDSRQFNLFLLLKEGERTFSSTKGGRGEEDRRPIQRDDICEISSLAPDSNLLTDHHKEWAKNPPPIHPQLKTVLKEENEGLLMDMGTWHGEVDSRPFFVYYSYYYLQPWWNSL